MPQPQWRLVEHSLDHIFGELVKHPAFKGGGGPNPGSSSYNANWEKLAKYERILLASLKTLKSNAHLLGMQAKGIRKMPRQFRYSAQQSVRDRGANIAAVQEKAIQLLELLKRMSGDYSSPDMGSINKLLKSAEEGFEAITLDDSHSQAFNGPAYTNPGIPAVNFPIHTLLALVVYYLIHLRNKNK